MAGKACRRRDHVLLGDPAFEEALGIRELERPHAAVRREVGVEDDEIVVAGGELHELVSVGVHDVLVRHGRFSYSGAALRLAFQAARRLEPGQLHVRGRAEPEPGEAFLDPGAELLAGALERLLAGRARVPAVGPAVAGERGRMLHERDALALDRVRDEGLRCVAPGPKAGEDCAERGMVVAVARLDLPPERAELRGEVAEREDLVGPLVGLELVAVDDDPESAEPVVRGGLERLPVLALLQLAVACHHDGQTTTAGAPLAPRDPAPLRDAHAERAGVGLDARDADVRVPVEPAEPAQAREALGRKHAEPVQRRVEPRHVVTLRREEHVALRVVETELRDVQLGVEEMRHDVERAEARPEVPRARPLHRDERVQPADVGDQRQRRVGAGTRRADAVDALPVDERELGHGERR